MTFPILVVKVHYGAQWWGETRNNCLNLIWSGLALGYKLETSSHLRRSVSFDKAQHALPGIGCIFHHLQFEETMGSAWIDNDLVLNASLVQPLIEGLSLADRNDAIGVSEQAEDRV